jgi:hypothetical protein
MACRSSVIARQGTAHAGLVARILDLQAGNTPAP